jgi:hypothetical protein
VCPERKALVGRTRTVGVLACRGAVRSLYCRPVSRRSRLLKYGLIAFGLVVMVIGVGAWRVFRVEDVPDELPPMERSPDEIALDSMSEAPALRLADLRGKTAFFVVVGPQSGKDKGGIPVNRALNRWQYPDSTVGFIVADATGMGVLADMAQKYIDFFRKEARFPLYVDFDGQMLDVFKLAKGHHGLVVLGPDGAVIRRASGGLSPAEIEALRVELGASEPAPPPPAPDFEVGGLTKASCRARACAIVFVGEPVARTDIPGIEDGFDGDTDESFARLNQPAIRLAATAFKTQLQGAPGVVVGRITGLELPGWTTVDDAASARAAFDIAEGESAFVVVDGEGRLAFREVGLIPMYKWGAAADLLGAEIMSDED